MVETLLLLGSGSEQRNAPLLRDLAGAARLALLQPGPVTWQKPYVAGFASIDPADVRGATDAARSLAESLGVEAVVSYDETCLLLAAELAHRLGLPGLPREGARVVRDKLEQRTRLAAGPPRPTGSILVHDLAGARAAADLLRYPVVVKPRSLSGSLGVIVAAGPDELGDLFDHTATVDGHGMPLLDGALVEEFLDGPEFSVDCWALDGHAEALFTGLIFKGYAPHAINIGCVVGAGIAEPEVLAEVEAAACAAAVVCGLDRTVANVDMRWVHGEPRVLEVNGRPAGELLPELARLTCGLSMGAALGTVALGRRPARPAPPHRAAGVAFVAPQRPLSFGGLDVPASWAGADWLLQVQATRERGERVTPPPADPWGRAGWVMVTEPTAAGVRERLEQAWSGVRVLESADPH